MQREWIALSDQARHRLIKAQRLPQIAMQHALPVVDVLPPQGYIETIGVTNGLDVARCRAFAEHLLHRIARNTVNEQEYS